MVVAFSNTIFGSHHEDSDYGYCTYAKMKNIILSLERTIEELLESSQNHEEKTKALEQRLTHIDYTCNGTLVEFREAMVMCSGIMTLPMELMRGFKKVVKDLLKFITVSVSNQEETIYLIK